MSISPASSFGQAREVLTTVLQNKAVKNEQKQQLQLLASANHSERQEMYEKKSVGRHLDAQA